MSDLVSVVRSLPEALDPDLVGQIGGMHDVPKRATIAWDHMETIHAAARLLAGLFAECPNCEGDGWLMPEGFEKGDYDARAFGEGVDCPSCRGGVVIKPDIIVRMATEIPTVHSTPADCEYWYDRCNCNQIIAERALWAVFGDEWFDARFDLGEDRDEV